MTVSTAMPIALASVAENLTPGQRACDTQAPVAGEFASPIWSPDIPLRIACDFLDEIEAVRMALDNRTRDPGETSPCKCGECHKCAAYWTQLARYRSILDAGRLDLWEQRKEEARKMEDSARKEVEWQAKNHPLAGPWIASRKGIGPKQGGRMVASIGNPLVNGAEGRLRRGPAELWAYCGYAPGQKRQRGVKSNWNAEAKMRTFLCAENAIKAGVRKLDGCDDSDGYDVARRQATTPFAQAYLDARANWADRDVSDGHRHNHALRVTAKAILKDLWLYARDHA